MASTRDSRGHTYPHPRPAVTVDVAPLVVRDAELRVLLVERGEEPYRGAWALPGGHVDRDEDLPDAARRELLEETGIRATQLYQLGAYGKPGRDPRGHTVTVAFLAPFPVEPAAQAADDAASLDWFALRRPPAVAFDHEEILHDVRRFVRRQAYVLPLLFAFLQRDFSLAELEEAHRAVVGKAPGFEHWAARQPWLAETRPGRYRLRASEWPPVSGPGAKRDTRED